MLVKPKDKDPIDRKHGVIYWHQCGELTCNEEYIGETSRTFGERYKEHLKEPSPIHGHSSQSGHCTNPDNFTIIEREDHGLTRTIKKSIYIRVNGPTLNSNVGKYNLNNIWDRVLFNKLTEHPSVGMLSPFQPVGMHIQLWGIVGMVRLLSMHTEYLRTNN